MASKSEKKSGKIDTATVNEASSYRSPKERIGQRPLSPHLQVYKPQLTSVLSIFHRASGIVLCAGVVAMAIWLIGLAYSPDVFERAAAFYTTWFGQLVFAGFVAAFFYHFCNGIRHLFWDAGRGFELGALYKSGYFVLGAAVVLTGLYLGAFFVF